MKVCLASLHINLNKKIDSSLIEKTLQNWRLYAQKYGYDVRFFENYIIKDHKDHPAWQKLLIFNQLRSYDLVCWIDTDILFTPQAPSFEIEKMEQILSEKKVLGVKEPLVLFKNHQDEYRNFYLNTLGRLPKKLDLFNSGLFIASPRLMGDDLEKIFWEGDITKTHYEMPALNEYIFNHEDMYLEMDKRFNQLYIPLKSMNFIKNQLLNLNLYHRLQYWKYEMDLYPNKLFIRQLIKNSFAIHFCGSKQLAQKKALELIFHTPTPQTLATP